MRLCGVADCGRKHRAKGYCKLHYTRVSKTGTTELDKVSDEDRFWSRVEIGATDECWNWAGARISSGYGAFRSGSYSSLLAHRFAVKAPEDKVVDHQCRNRLCVNPRHLIVTDVATNNQNQGVVASNSSGYRGVSRRRDTGSWAAYASAGGVRIIQTFKTLEEAVVASLEFRGRIMTNNVDDRKNL